MYLSEEKQEEVKKKLRSDLVNSNKNDDIKTIKEFIRQRIPLTVKSFKNLDPNDTNLITKQQFKDVLSSFKLQQRLFVDNLIDPLIEEFKESNNNCEFINYKNFIEHLADFKELNDFFHFKDKHLDKLKNAIDNSKKLVSISNNLIQQEEDKKHILKEDLENEIKKHEEAKHLERLKEIAKSNEINNIQPSKEFNDLIFKNKELTSKKYKEFESNFSAHPSLRKEVKAKTRFGANPEIKSTKWITEQDPKSGMFISENDRFKKIDFQKKEHEAKLQKYKSKIEILKNHNDIIDNLGTKTLMVKEHKKMYSLLQRSEKLYKYELLNKLRNELIE